MVKSAAEENAYHYAETGHGGGECKGEDGFYLHDPRTTHYNRLSDLFSNGSSSEDSGLCFLPPRYARNKKLLEAFNLMKSFQFQFRKK